MMPGPELTPSAQAAIEVSSNVLTVRKIFKYLNAQQLNICSRVCKLWNEEAKKEKSSRYQIYWNTFVFNEEHEADDSDDDDSSQAKESWWDSVNAFIKDSPFVPAAAMIFCSDSLYSEFEVSSAERGRGSGGKQKASNEAYTFFPTGLPESCKVHVTVADGIIGTDEAMKTKEYDECEMAMSIVLFGNNWDFKLHPFSCSHNHCQSMLKYWTGKSNEIPDCFSSFMKAEVKMFNLFSPLNGVDQEIGYSLFRMFNWPLIAGGSVSFRFVKTAEEQWQSNSSSCRLSGVAISGQSVQVASVLIRSNVDTEEGVDACIKELTEHNFPLERSFGLMYACVGRGPHIYCGNHDVESKIFRKYFPNTPLFGFFGNGEIGMQYPQVDPLYVPSKRKCLSSSADSSSSSRSGNSVDSEDSQDSQGLSKAQLKRQISERKRKDNEFKMKHPPKLMHAYTTVMCLISVQKER